MLIGKNLKQELEILEGVEFKVILIDDLVIKKCKYVEKTNKWKTSPLSFIERASKKLSKTFPEIRPHYKFNNCLICDKVVGHTPSEEYWQSPECKEKIMDFKQRLKEAGYKLLDIGRFNTIIEEDGQMVFIDLGRLKRGGGINE
jgi:RIO-like serine/threonine protein kinase